MKLKLLTDDQIPNHVIDPIIEELNENEITVVQESRDTSGPYNSLDWLIPTGIILYITKPYFEAVLQKMGEDHYSLLKKCLKNKLFPKLFGEDKEVERNIYDSAGKKESIFSRNFSIEIENENGSNILILFPENCTEIDFELSLNSIPEIISDNPTSFINNIEQYNKHIFTNLLYFNPVTEEYEFIDIIESGKQKTLITKKIEQ